MIDFGRDPICPECEQGKHGNCDGTAWDHLLDELTTCQCEVCECTPVNFVPYVEPEEDDATP